MNPAGPEETLGFDSRNSEIIIVDGPGDTTIRQVPPHLMPILLAQREQLHRWQKLMEQAQPPEQTLDELSGKNTEQI